MNVKKKWKTKNDAEFGATVALTLSHSSEQTQTHVARPLSNGVAATVERRLWLRWWRYRRWQTPDVEEEGTGGIAVNLPFSFSCFTVKLALLAVVHAPLVVFSHSVSLPLSRRESVRRICTHLAQVLRFSCLLSVVRQSVRRLWFECRYTHTQPRQKLTHENSNIIRKHIRHSACCTGTQAHNHFCYFTCTACCTANEVCVQLNGAPAARMDRCWRLFLVRCSMKSLSHLLFMFARYVISRRCLDTGYFRDELITTRNDWAQKVPYLSITFVWCHMPAMDAVRLDAKIDKFPIKGNGKLILRTMSILFAIHQEWCWPNRMLDIVQSICQLALIVVVIVIGWHFVCVQKRQWPDLTSRLHCLLNHAFLCLLSPAHCVIYIHIAWPLPSPVRIINKTFPIRRDIHTRQHSFVH